MNKQLFIFHATDFRKYPIQGTIGTIKNFLKHTKYNCRLIGLTNTAEYPIGKWQRITIEKRQYDFLPIARSKKEIIPHKVLMLLGTIIFWRRIVEKCQGDILNAMFLVDRECYSSLKFLNSRHKKINAFYKMTDAVNPLQTSGRRLARLPILQTIYFALFFKPLITDAKLIFSISDECREFCEKVLIHPTQRNKIIDLNHFVDFDKLMIDFKNARPVKKPHSTVLIFWGRIVVIKGLELMIHSIRKLQDKGYDFKLWIVGDGEEKKKLELLSDRLKLKEHVKFLGGKSIEEIAALSKYAKLFLMSSHSEGLPTAMLEALTFGLPVVSTSVGGIRTLVSEGVNGYLIHERDDRLYAEAILKAMDLDREKAREYGRNIVKKAYSAKSIVHKIDFCMDSITNSSRPEKLVN